jgi:DNA-directed RNA polymerase specialized sigma24 family protein
VLELSGYHANIAAPLSASSGRFCMASAARKHFDDCDDAEKLRRMEEVVETMNRRDRRIFLMHRVDDLSYREIARICHISTAKVEQAMFRALTHMSQIWDEDYIAPVRKWWQFWSPR